MYFWLLLVALMLILGDSDAGTFEDDVTLSAKQRVILDIFKNRMADRLPHDYMKEDIYLVRWLKVQDWNLEAAERMLIKNLRWRKDERMDEIQNEDWSEYKREYQYWLEGRDKQGRPVLYFDMGAQGIRKEVIKGRLQHYLRYLDKILDETFTLVRTLGEKYGNVTRAQLIADLNDFNFVQHVCLQCGPAIFRIILSYENHFPLGVDQILLINTPEIFVPLLQEMKIVMTPETRRILRVFGRNRQEWKAAMAKDFDFDQLPPAFGGTRIYSGMDYDY